MFFFTTVSTACTYNESTDNSNGNTSETTLDVSASNTNTYESFVCDVVNDGILSTIEKNWWSGTYHIEEPKELKKEFTFQNAVYKGVYFDSHLRELSWVNVDNYECEDSIIIRTISGTDEICGFHIGDIWARDKLLPKSEDPYNNALLKAKTIASQYIDVDDYTLFENERIIDEITFYEFEFVKVIHGCRTLDRIIIHITDRGTLRTLNIGNINALDSVAKISIDQTAVSKSLDAKIHKLYKDISETFSYEPIKQTLTYTPEGNLVIVTDIDVTLSDGRSTGVLLATVIPVDASAELLATN